MWPTSWPHRPVCWASFRRGYSRVYARNKLWLLRDLDRSLDRHGLLASQLLETGLPSSQVLAPDKGRRLKPGSGPMLEKFLAHLRNTGTVATRIAYPVAGREVPPGTLLCGVSGEGTRGMWRNSRELPARDQPIPRAPLPTFVALALPYRCEDYQRVCA